MKLFRVIILLSSLLLVGCMSSHINTVRETQGQFENDIPYPVMLTERQALSLPGMLWNNIQYLRFSLNNDEKKMHQSAVYHALNDAEIGVITSWYSRERMAMGQVRVIDQWPESNGYCRVYQAYIKLNGAQRHMTNKACKALYSGWVFLR